MKFPHFKQTVCSAVLRPNFKFLFYIGSAYLFRGLSSIIYIYIQISYVLHCIVLKYDKWSDNIPKKHVESQGLFSQAHVTRTPSEFPVGSHEQLNATPWPKAQSLTLWLFFFFLIEELLCFRQGALSSATPPWPFFMPFWPRCSHRAPIAALEMPFAHSAIFEDVDPL